MQLYVLFPKAREIANSKVATSLMQEILAEPKHTSTPEKGKYMHITK